MSRGLRRTLSWLLVLALIAAAVIAWQFVPGSGGLEEELRWLLARDYVPPGHFNRASALIRFTEQERPGKRAALLRALLFDKDARVVHGGLTLLQDRLREDPLPEEDLHAVFAEWVRATPVEAKLAHLRLTLMCCHGIGRRTLFWEDWNPTDPQVFNLPTTEEDYRWMVAGTLRTGGDGRAMGDALVFGRDEDAPYNLAKMRLHYLDNAFLDEAYALLSRHMENSPHALLDGLFRQPIETVRLEQMLRPSVALLVRMLSDPIDQVRWGAGRILAVAGDARGMPAFCEWLAHNPRRTRAANELMTGLYGANWRDLCESGSAASQPGAGNGGG